MKPQSCDVPLSARNVLPGADFADAFETIIPGSPTAKVAAVAALGTAPPWIAKLMQLRNAIFVPLGLKPGANGGAKIGPISILSEDPNRMVLGLDDSHLDFRIVFDTVSMPNHTTKATLTTVLKRHNIWGRAYLAVVLPFHKLIVPAMLARAKNVV
jgi:Protein of unknown function (DUF2867)